MIKMMKFFTVTALLIAQVAVAQKQVTKEDELVTTLKKSVSFLADDKLEGRRTGSAGEKLAYEFIQKAFKAAGLQTFTADKSYIQPFDVNEGKEAGPENALTMNGKKMVLNEDYFPYPFSANTSLLKFTNDDIAFLELGDVLTENKNNPHFELTAYIIDFSNAAAAKGTKIVIVRDYVVRNETYSFDAKDKNPALTIPVIYTFPQDKRPYNESTAATTGSSVTVSVKEKKRTGHNVIGYINNKAPYTIILGAHYDHLGYGEDHNSLYAGTERMIHNGADDNASGTAALIELGKWLKKSAYKKYNYILVAFSGEELGLFGSKYFTEHAGLDMKTVNYMINMDMIGRLNDSTHGLTIGGFGTSPAWGKLIKKDAGYFKINTDSSGSGPSDHTSFYRKDVPVLFFFTGSHKDYHKPSDDADKVNYNGEVQVIRYIQNIITQTDGMDKLSFTKTSEAATGKNTFKVSLGIMPDYTYSEKGVRVDGVSDNRPAQKAGVQTGDVLMQLGEHHFTDVQSYMDALNKFKKGDSTNVKLMRGTAEMVLPITF